MFKLKLKQTNLCEFCQSARIDTILHFFYECPSTNMLWRKLENVYFHNVLTKEQVIHGPQRGDVNNVDGILIL